LVELVKMEAKVITVVVPEVGQAAEEGNRHIACVSVKTSSQVCSGFCSGVTAGDRHSEVAVDSRNEHNKGLVVVGVPVILSVACGVWSFGLPADNRPELCVAKGDLPC
jgi:hypothetical protein